MRFGVFTPFSTDFNSNLLHTHGAYENIISKKRKGTIYICISIFFSYDRKYFKNNSLLLLKNNLG